MIFRSKEHLNESVAAAFIFFCVLFFVYWVYAPGINGLFIFDDIHNLQPLGKYEGLGLLDNFLLLMLENQSGPTGRPLSMASFYLNDVKWPSTPSSFINTNILIHLLNGALVFWLTQKLSNYFHLTPTQKAIFPLLVTALWLIHPMHSTTVLYVIQRMTELSATFILSGLLFYIYGKEKLETNVIHGLGLLYLGVGLSLLLAILSKENGIILVGYILVLDKIVLKEKPALTNKAYSYWKLAVVFMPFAFILFYLSTHIFNQQGFEQRNFTLAERLLTEPRVLMDYVRHIIAPDMGNTSLFHDDLVISTGLFNPLSTIASIAVLISSIVVAIWVRHKYPLISLAIAWFLVGHLLESTSLPLELYFEHRNYLPMLGIIMLASWTVIKLAEKIKIPTIAVTGSMLLLFSFITHQNAILWSKPLELSANWYESHPNSQRAREMYISVLQMSGLNEQLKLLDKNKPSGESLFIATSILSDLSRHCISGEPTTDEFKYAITELGKQVIHPSAAYGLIELVTNWRQGKCSQVSFNELRDFLEELASLEMTKKSSTFANHVHYRLSQIYQDKNDFNNTMINLDKSYEYMPNTELLKLKATYLASAGLYELALETLNDTSQVETGIRSKLALMIKEKEINKLKENIKKMMTKSSLAATVSSSSH